MDIVEEIREKAQGRKIKAGDLFDAVKSRGFGPLLIIPSLIVILPTGAIPGVPDVCAIIMILISAQIVAGRESPWIPKKIKKMSFSAAKMRKAMDKAEPVLQKIDDFSKRRLTVLTTPTAQRVFAALIVVMCCVSITVGMIPYVPALIALPIMIFAIGLTVGDGLLMLIGLFCVAGGAGIISTLL